MVYPHSPRNAITLLLYIHDAPSQGTVSSQLDYSVDCTQILAAYTKIKSAARRAHNTQFIKYIGTRAGVK